MFLPVGAAERGHVPGRVRHRVDRARTRSSSASRSRSSHEAAKSGQFAFPPIIDVRIDQEKTRDRHRPRQGRRRWASACSRSARTSSSMLGGNFVNRFNIDGRSYKVIPQIERVGAAHARPAREHLHHRPARRSSCRSAPSRRCNEGVEPRTLNRFQQLNAVKISGRRAALARRRRSRCSRTAAAQDPAARLPRRLHGRVAAAPPGGRASSCRRWASRCVLIFLVLAAQFNSFRDPFVILAGLGAARDVRRAHLHVPEVLRPAGHALQADRGLDDDAQHLLAGRPRHARRPGRRRTASSSSSSRTRSRSSACRSSRRCTPRRSTRLRPILMTTVATVVGHFPLTLVTRRRAPSRGTRSASCSSAA